MNQYTEDSLIEQPAIKLFQELGYDYENHYNEKIGQHDCGREEMNDVILQNYLKITLVKLNPDVSTDALNIAMDEIYRSRAHLTIEQANKEVYKLLRDGVKAEVSDENGNREIETVKIIDFENPEENHFYLTSQFWVAGDMYKRRADLIGFVNGIPLIFVELKASHKNLKSAYSDNLKDYKATIPQLFWYNAFIILSNGIESKVGSVTSEWEHFNDWKKINSEGEKGIVSMETMIKGLCEKTRFIDILENFMVFDDSRGKIAKIIARNHQYLGVNRSIESFKKSKENGGKIGVFWHTQGSGKSISMVFFSQKILRKFAGNYTFVIITDRKELDDQIYKQFQNAGAVTEKQVQAESGKHLKDLLQEDHRLIFTLIQKFGTKTGEVYPQISERNDIIVMTDEAHRSQYEILALNMRNALPNANFIGFTGTPLIAGQAEKTKDVFGDYVSVYNFKQSIDDKATVPLFYENRIPELQLKNEDLDDDLERLIEEAELDEEQEKKLEREFARQYHLITRDDRLEKVAKDIVYHFFGHESGGKAMVVSIDKATAVRMYDKVQKYLKIYIEDLKKQLKECSEEERTSLEFKLMQAEDIDMAVVVSQEQNEIAKFKERGLDIEKHRRRMVNEKLEKKFKDEDDSLQIVFVCNMWLTGFDVPSLSTLYLDKPMKNHSLMQAIARANRVFKDKNNGLIVDYIGVFRNLQKALAIYASGESETGESGIDMPIRSKQALVEDLEAKIEEAKELLKELNIDFEKIYKASELEKLKHINDFTNWILKDEETKKKYRRISSAVYRLYKAILPDKKANDYLQFISALKVISARISSLEPMPNIEDIQQGIEKLLDESIETGGYDISSLAHVDLSEIDFEKLKEYFEKNRRNLVNEALKTNINERLKKMMEINPSRINLMEKFQTLIDEYNAGTINAELFFDKLVAFTNELSEEEKRHISEGLTDEELTLFDILRKPKLSESEEKQVKKSAKALLDKLKWEKLMADWKRTQQRRAGVLITIRNVLDEELPRSYEKPIYEQKCDEVYKHIYDSYEGAGRSIYVE